MSDRGFDPGAHLSKVGGAEYLEVKWRLVWLRNKHPDAVIETEHIELTDERAVFRCRVSLPNDGGMATGYGSETPRDFRDYIEKAETKAIGRALAALGFGTQFTPDFDEGGAVADTPVARLRAVPPNIDPQTGEVLRSNGPRATTPSQPSNATHTNGSARSGGPQAQPGTAGASGPSEPQRKAIFAITGRLLGLRGDELDAAVHAIAKALYGIDSLTQLTKGREGTASAFIDYLTKAQDQGAVADVRALIASDDINAQVTRLLTTGQTGTVGNDRFTN